jgi:hypothetical protein
MAQEKARTLARIVVAFVSYLALAILLTYPLVLSLRSALPVDAVDSAFSAWVLFWDARTFPLSAAWWNAPAFSPVPGTMAFSDGMLGVAILTSPMQWLGASPILSYNLAFLLSFPLSAVGAYLLSLHLTGREDAAFFAGLAFGFAPFRMSQLSHIQMLSTYGAPLALLGLHLYLKTRRSAWLWLFGSAWLLQALSNGYFVLFFSVLILLWIAFFGSALGISGVLRVFGAWVLASLPLLPLLLKYRAIHSFYGFSRTLEEVEAFSARIESLVHGSPFLRHWPWTSLEPSGQEAWLFPGLVTPCLVLVGLASSLKVPPLRGRGTAILALLAVSFAVVALGATLWGPWHLVLGPLSVSVTTIEKPVSWALLFLFAALLTHPRLVDAHRRRSAFAFYVLGAGLMWVMTLGPHARIRDFRILDKAPYFWLMKLPGFSQLRVPSRFAMLGTLCLAVAASLVLGTLLKRLRRGRPVWLCLACFLALWDGWIKPLPLAFAPTPSLSPRPPGGAVLELPLGGPSDAAAVFRGVFHGLPVVNGYSSYYPPHYFPLRLGLQREEDEILEELRRDNPLYVVVDPERDPRASRYLERQKGVVKVPENGPFEIYLLPPTPRPPAPGAGPLLSVRAIWANVNPADAQKMIDGDPSSRWTTGAPQRGTENIVVDLGEPRNLGSLTMAVRFPTDYPRELVIETSLLGEEWQEAWHGATAGKTLRGCLEDPRNPVLFFDLAGERARFLRLRETASDPVYYWSVAELGVREFASALQGRAATPRRPFGASSR